MKFLDPCVVPYLVVTLTLYHGLLQLKMKENDQILMYCQLSLSDVQAGYEKDKNSGCDHYVNDTGFCNTTAALLGIQHI